MAGEYYNTSVTWTGASAGSTTTATWGDGTYWVTPWYNGGATISPLPEQKSINLEELERKVEELEKKLAKEGGKMRSLYKVYVVDPRKLGKLLDETTVIAETEEQALLKAGVAQTAQKAGLELEQVDTFVDELGQFIRPRKETQRVKMVKEEDDD